MLNPHPDTSIIPAPMGLTLVRHGETEGESSIRYHGRTDVPLSRLGRQQMHGVQRALQGRAFAAVYASTLSRSVEAAAIAAGGAGVMRIAGFDEIDFGTWEGLTAEEIAASDPEGYAYWRAQPGDFAYPGGESTAQFRTRVADALRGVLGAAPGGELLMVVHKGVIRCILAELLRLSAAERAAITVDLASIHEVRLTNGEWCAAVLDRTDHL